MRVHRRSLSLIGMAALVTAAAHHIYFPVIMLAILTALGLWLADRPRLHNSAPILSSLALALTPAVTLFAVIAFAFMHAGYAAPLDASARSFVDAWHYGTRESPALWVVILASGIVGLATLRGMRGDPAWLFAASLLTPTGLSFFSAGHLVSFRRC